MVNVCVDPRREEGVRVFSWVDEVGLSLIQETVVEKHNELQAIPEVLDSLDLSGAVVSIDAMGTQTAIAEQIIRSNADYVLVSRATRNICMRMSNLILQVNINIILTKPWRKIMVVLRSARLVPFIGFLFQPVSFELQRLQVVLLYVHHFLGSLYDGAEYGIHRTQNDSREEHDTEAEREWTEQRENIDRFGARER